MKNLLGKKDNHFVERSLTAAVSFIKEAVASDEIAARRGLLQACDARLKVILLLCSIIAVLWMRDARMILAVYALCCGLAVCSRISLWFFLKRTWVFIPLFSLFIAVPALFSTFTPGVPLVALHVWGIHGVITRQGLSAATLFVARVLVTVSLAILATITTRVTELFAALRWMRVPKLFVMTLGMCYRYIFLFASIVQDTFLAIRSRTGSSVSHRKGQRIVAWNISALWQRSFQLNRDVYNAMRSRGYTGEPHALHVPIHPRGVNE